MKSNGTCKSVFFSLRAHWKKDYRKNALYKSGRKSPSKTSPWGHIVPGLLIPKHKNLLLKPFILICILEWQAEQINAPEVSSADEALWNKEVAARMEPRESSAVINTQRLMKIAILKHLKENPGFHYWVRFPTSLISHHRKGKIIIDNKGDHNRLKE